LSTATTRPIAERASLAVAALLALSPAAKSADWSFGVDAGIGETDNIALTAADRLSQTVAIADLDFAFKQQSQRLDAAVKGDFSYFDFLQHAYGTELAGRFDGLARLALLTDQLTWTLRDDFGQAPVTPYAAPTPGNRENIEYLSTGPDWTLRFGSTEFVTLSARYALAQYQTSPFDSNRALASVAWGMDLSEHSKFSLEASNERVLFDNTVLNTDFDTSSGFAHYELHGARTELVTSLGVTIVTQPGGSMSAPLLTFALTRAVSEDAKLTLSGGRVLTDTTSSFSTLQGGAISAITTAPAPQTSAPYTSTYASLGWRWERARTTLAVSGRWERDTYRDQPLLGYGHTGGELSLQHRLTGALSAQLFGSVYHTDYHPDFTTNDVLGGAGLVMRAGRDLEFQLRYNHVSRSANVIGEGYAQNFVFLTIGYRPQQGADH
jgi:hypothetical protein